MRTARSIPIVVAAAYLIGAVALANVLVNQDPTPPPRIQNTPSIGVSPTFPVDMCVAYVDQPGMWNGIGTSWSIDGGMTWTDSNTPPPSIVGIEQDPSLIFDYSGTILVGYSTYDFLQPSQSGIMCSMSWDGGQNFQFPSTVVYNNGPVGSIPLEIKPKIETDDHPSSPFFGNVYVVWERDLTNWFNSVTCFSSAPSVGTPWSPSVALNDAPGHTWLALWPDLAVGPDGRIFSAWLDTPFWMQHQGTIYVDSSGDAGVTWGRDVPAVTFWSVPQIFNDATGLQTHLSMSYPSIEVDPSNPQRACMVYAADPDNGTTLEARIDVLDQPPGTADAQFLNPFSGASQMAAENGWVHAVWIDHRAGYGDVYYNRSQNGLATWPYSEALLSTQQASFHTGSNNANIVTTGNNVYVTWDEWQGVDFVHLIFFQRSTDNGQTWLATPIFLDHQGRTGYGPIVSCSGNNVCVVWEGVSAAGVEEIRVNYSTNGGVTWQNPEIRIPSPVGVRAFRPHIASTGNMVYVVWYQDAGGGNADIYISRSTNAGQTWSTPYRVSHPVPAVRFGPKVACTPAGQVYVTWVDKRTNAVENPYFTFSNDFGVTWWPDARVNVGVPAAGTTIDRDSQIACNGNDVYVVYTSDRNGTPGTGPTDIFCAYSPDGGLTWIDNRVDLGDSGGKFTGANPRISLDGTFVYVVWQDDRNAAIPRTNWDIYGTYSWDGGISWLGSDYRIDMGDPPGANLSERPHLASDYTGPYYGWREMRNGNGDVYVNQYRTGPDEGDIFFIETLDGGATWSNPLRVNDDPGTNDQSHPWLDIKPDGTVDVVWYDTRTDPNDRLLHVFFAALGLGSGAFTPNVPVNLIPIIPPPFPVPGLGDYIWVDVDSTNAHVVWTDTRVPPDNLQGDIFYVSEENPVQTAVDDEESSLGLPHRPHLHATSPNPFRSEARLTFFLPEDMEVELLIYGPDGGLVATVVEGVRTAGTHTVSWDGRGDDGTRVSPGVYFSRLEAGGVVRSQKIVLLR